VHECELTDISTAGVIAESNHGADSLGVGLLHQQLDDGLAICLNQVFTLAGQRGGQECAHLLHSLNNLLLIQDRQVSRTLGATCTNILLAAV